MAETVFSCSCGMILKVYGEGQAGSRIECPSCKSSVVVPPTGRAAVPSHAGDAPGVEGGADATTDRSNVYLFSYLLILIGATLGVVYYVMLPSTGGPAGNVRSAAGGGDGASETRAGGGSEDPPKRANKFGKARSRKFDEPEEPDTEPPLPVYETSSTSGETPAPRPPSPEPATPVTARREEPATEPDPTPAPSSEPRPRPGRRGPAPRPGDDAPYAHISNRKAREFLTFALRNTSHARATLTAEVFLKKAENAAPGDFEVMAEVKKLRAKIATIMDRAIPEPSPFAAP